MERVGCANDRPTGPAHAPSGSLGWRPLAWAVVVLIGVAVGTGVALSFLYRPEPPDAFGLQAGRPGWHDPLVAGHVVSTIAACVALVWRCLAGVRRVEAGRRAAGAAAIVVGALLAFTGGPGLAWDFVALEAVTVGSISGIWTPVLDADVVFVIDGIFEVGVDEYRRRVLLHLLIWPALVAAGAWLSRPVGRFSTDG